MSASAGIPSWIIFSSKGQLAVGTGPYSGKQLASGTSGQVLSVGGTDPSGLQWIGPAALAESGFTAAGQLYTGTGSGTGELLAKGAAGTVLTVGGADASGLEWVTPSQVLIASNILGSPAGSVTFSSIPATYNHLKLVVIGRSDQASSQSIALQFNGDTGNNYVDGWIIENVASASAQNSSATSSLFLSNMSSSGATAGEAAYVAAEIPLYAGTTFRKGVMALATATDSTVQQAGATGGRWLSTAAINSIKVLAAAGNFVTGSAFYLYGIT